MDCKTNNSDGFQCLLGWTAYWWVHAIDYWQGANLKCGRESWNGPQCNGGTVMLRMVLPNSGPPGPCTAATNSPPGPSMGPQTVPLGPSVAPQVVPPQNQCFTLIFIHIKAIKWYYGSHIERRLLDYIRGNRWTAKRRFQTNQQWKFFTCYQSSMCNFTR